jgi:hypothetical protein
VSTPGGPLGDRGGCRVGDRVGGPADHPEQIQDAVGVVARAERIGGELQQRRARDAVTVRAARLDHAGGEQVVEPIGHQVGHQPGELVGAPWHAGLVDVDELIGPQAEDLAQLGAVPPRREQVADAGQRVAAFLETGDEPQALQVARSVDPHPAPPPGRGKQAHRLVLADRPHRQIDPPGQLVDRQLEGRVRCGIGRICSHGPSTTGEHRYGKYRDDFC